MADGKKICGRCNQPVKAGHITALERVWCPEHFVCFKCERKIEGTFVPKKDNYGKAIPWCKNCGGYDDSGVCGGCGRSLAGCTILTALDRKWHPNCFKCSKCSQVMDASKSFRLQAGKPICDKC